jgi:hypothetical protein
MKQTLLFAVAVLISLTGAFGQGTLIFNNNASAAYNLYTNNSSGTPLGLISGAGRYRVGLYASTNLSATAGSLELVGLATNTALAGKFNGGSAFVLPNGYPSSQQIVFQLRAWSLGAGTSFAEALTAAAADPLNVALGASPLGTTTPGGGLIQAGALFGTTPGLLSSGFGLGVPEPSSIALGLLGLGAIALFRRRR